MVLLDILIILLLILLNGYLVMAELALVAARQARLQARAEKGNHRAQAALELVRSPDRPLSTIQIGVTLIGILSGAVGGATVGQHLGNLLQRVPFLAPYSQALGVAIVVVLVTYFSLVLGELVPKRLARANPEQVIMAATAPLRFLMTAFWPVVRLLTASMGLVVRLLGRRVEPEPPVTEEEIRVLLEQGTAAGVFEEAERMMLTGVFRLNDRPIGAVATPRTEIAWLDLDDPPEKVVRYVVENPHSRFPVARGDLDHVVGVIRGKSLLARRLAAPAENPLAVLDQPLFVPETMVTSRVLELFRKRKRDLALVMDEYGGLQGLVTTRDILEEIVGPLEQTSPQAVRREDGSWLIDGMLPIDEFKDLLDLPELPGEEEGNYQTVAGFALMQLGRIPRPADFFSWDGLRIEILDMDGNRIDKLLVVPNL